MFYRWVQKRDSLHSSVYRILLDRWTPILSCFQINEDISVVSNVDLYKKMSTNTTRKIEQLQGENSSIHEITLNTGHVFILKHNTRHGYSMREEAQLQHYATYIHAPEVYAFDDDNILMEKCTPLEKKDHKTLGLMEDGIKLFQFREEVFKFNAISRALSAGRLLPRTVALYDRLGLFSTDVHSGNFLQRKQTIVHIDFDEMFFKTDKQYSTFKQLYPGRFTKRVMEKPPRDPPFYYWWADSILNENDQKTWSRQQWLDEIETMKQLYTSIEAKLQSFIQNALEQRKRRVHSRVANTQGSLR